MGTRVEESYLFSWNLNSVSGRQGQSANISPQKVPCAVRGGQGGKGAGGAVEAATIGGAVRPPGKGTWSTDLKEERKRANGRGRTLQEEH